jgi:hypothetical protein
MAEKKEKEVVEEATKPVAPIDLSALKNLDVASERDESLKGIKKASEMKKKKSKFCFMESNRIPLLSGGRYYLDAEDEDLRNGFIKLYPISMAEEEVLTNQAYLKSNSAFRILFENCMASNYDASRLLSYDVYYLLYALRNISYGSDYKFDCKCAECGKEFKKEINIEEVDWEEIPNDVKDVNEIKLSVGYTVKIRLARLADEEESTRLKQTKKYEDVPDRIVNLVVQTLEIKDPDGELVNPNDWADFYEALPGKDRVLIQKCFEFANNVPMVSIICPKCGATRQVAIPMDRDFFRLS